jgi:hypothetical protein
VAHLYPTATALTAASGYGAGRPQLPSRCGAGSLGDPHVNLQKKSYFSRCTSDLAVDMESLSAKSFRRGTSGSQKENILPALPEIEWRKVPMKHQDPRIPAMFRRDCAAAIFSVLAVWLIYAFTFWSMWRTFEALNLLALMGILGASVLFLNSASTLAMIRHYREDMSAIYGTDVYYLDQIQRLGSSEGVEK